MFEKKAVIFRFTSCPVAESAPGGANVRKAVEGMDCFPRLTFRNVEVLSFPGEDVPET